MDAVAKDPDLPHERPEVTGSKPAEHQYLLLAEACRKPIAQAADVQASEPIGPQPQIAPKKLSSFIT